MKKETKKITTDELAVKTKKVSKKATKEVDVKETKKVAKTDTKKVTKKNDKKVHKSIFKSIREYFRNVNGELKKTKWPSKKDLISYSVATLIFVLVFALFFMFSDIIIAGIKQVLR